MRRAFALVSILTLAARALAAEPVADFSLHDHRGKAHSLAALKDKKLVVLAFVGVDCPVAKAYGARLAKLAAEYEPKGVAFLGLDPNCQDSLAQIGDYVKEQQVTFPILKDAGNIIADRLGVTRTPEVVVLDAERKVRYHGRVDDQYGVGYIRSAPQKHDLKLALDELLADRPVSNPKTESPGCLIGRDREPQSDFAVTYSNQIARLIDRHCVECHRPGDIAPFSLATYKQAAGWADMMLEMVESKKMPPWHADSRFGHFSNERRLSVEEMKQLRAWVSAGAPEGDPKDLPKPRTFTEGWQLPQPPDRVIAMRDRPFDVPAEGLVRYQYFVVDSGFKEDQWVRGMEVIPGNRSVVHHVLVFVKDPKQRMPQGEGGLFGFLAAYVPGLRPIPYPAGMAKRIPAGSQIVFQVHYTPTGVKRQDMTRLGLLFADAKDVTHEVRTTSAVQRRLSIAPGDANWRTTADSIEMAPDTLLLGMMPHMHLRGKSFLYELQNPDGTRETLLDVPQYDFNWQTGYRLAEPKPLTPGAKLHAVARFDNSEGNPANPDPKKTVRWGDQTWDEMMIGYFDIAVPLDPKDPEKAERYEQFGRALMVAKQLDKDNNGKIDRAEVPDRFRSFFDGMDKEKKGTLTVEEVAKGLQRLRK